MTRIILDTDLAMGQPGSDIDDGFALALALAEPELSVELVTTVNGNTDVDTATRLTVGLLQRIGREVEVIRGAGRPLVRAAPASPAGAERFVPASGTGRPPVHAAVALVERVMREPGELTLVGIGPLTNVALALALEPRVAESVREIVLMGGVFLGHTGVGVMPGEFNFWVDPDAAAVVLDSGAPLRLVGLDVTRRVRLDRADASALRRTSKGFATFAADCTDGWISYLERTTPGDDWGRGSCALHDPLAVAVVARPDLVTWRPARVSVERGSDHTRGVAVTDLLGTDDPPAANCSIAVDVAAEAFRSYFFDRIGGLP
jgi:inosine-uridine nucleoside N-ribohydrolase